MGRYIRKITYYSKERNCSMMLAINIKSLSTKTEHVSS